MAVLSSRPPDRSSGPGILARLRSGLGQTPTDLWVGAAEDPLLAQRAVARLTPGVTAGVVLTVLVARALGMPAPALLVVGLGAALVAASWVERAVLDHGILPRWLPLAHVATAVVLITIGVLATGSVQGPFVWAYSVAAAVEAMLRGLRWGMAVATLCSAFLVAGAAAGQAGWFASVRVTAAAPVGAYLVSYLGLFYVIVLVAAVLRVQVLEIARVARTDSLTGLGNLRALRQVLEREQAAAPDTPLSLLVVELDGFKAVNDRYGHLYGDEVLQRVAGVLRESCRATDFLTRFGGDEFVVILPRTGPAEAVAVAERVRAGIGRLRLPGRENLTASVGVAGSERRPSSVHQLLDAADRAMYQAKAAGGDRVVLTPV